MCLLADANYVAGLEKVWSFFETGGFFMFCIGMCSLVTVTVIVYKMIGLQRKSIVPARVELELERTGEYLSSGRAAELRELLENNGSALSRLSQVVLSHAGRTKAEVTEALQSRARQEIVRMNAGMPVLEVVITIAPLLGLLGTASGLVIVFSNLDYQGGDSSEIARGIGVALYTTIAGLAVAVPSVIAQSYFGRKIETVAVRLEVLLARMVSACSQQVFFKNGGSL